MKKKLLHSLLLLLCTTGLYSQDFLGLSTGNYAGVTGVLLQPASIADSRYKFDINIFSTGINYSNNYFLVNRDAILKFNKNNFGNYETFKARYLSEANLGANERAFLNITNRTQLPLSFMATLGKKSAIAFNMQSRSMIQGRNITRDLAQMAYNGFYYGPLNNQPLDASGLSINALNWVEAGLTYARVLYTSEKHFIKAAFTGKYLGGVASLNIGSDNFRIGVNTDSTINFSANNFRYNHNEKADFDMVFDRNFRPDASAFGFDAGLVYEYRGNLKNNRYIRNDDEVSYEEERRDVNKYIFKLGVSLLDMGMFRFNKAANVQNFNANVTSWDVRNSNYSTIKQFDTALAARVTPVAGDPLSYDVYLPAALSVQLDIRFVKGLYLNAMAYRPLATGGGSGVRFDNYGYYAITPRYERRHFGIYLPYSFADKNSITNYRGNSLGATVRFGPLFIGSSNLGSMLFNNNLSAADVHVGLKLGITYGKPSKVSRFFERTQAAAQMLPSPVPVAKTSIVKDTSVINVKDSTAPAQNRIAVDYNKGLVYGDDRKGSIIIINNNFYYDTSSRARNEAAARQVIWHNADSATLRHLVDSMQQSAAGKRQADTVQQLLQDSISQKKKQLDSLIRNLQQLRQQMDSSRTNGYNERTIPVQQDTVALSRRKDDQRLSDTSLSRRKTDSLTSAVNDKGHGQKTQRDTSVSQRINDSLTKAVNDTIIQERNSPGRADLRPRSDSLARTAVDTTPLLVKKQASGKKKIVADNEPLNAQRPGVKTTAVVKKDTVTTVVTVMAANGNEAGNYQENLYQKYLNESSRLQQEINSLRQRADDNRMIAYQPVAPYRYPVTVPQPTYAIAAPAYQPSPSKPIRDTIYIRDTIHLKDTLKLTDTLTITDTASNRPLAIQPVIPTVVKTDTVVEKTDYRHLPPEIVLFASGQSAVRKVYSNKLNYLASVLIKDTTLTLTITGHTDPTGPAAVNEALSLRRALAVKNYFTAKGIMETRLLTSSAGSGEPVITGTSKDANSQNRRVVIKIN